VKSRGDSKERGRAGFVGHTAMTSGSAGKKSPPHGKGEWETVRIGHGALFRGRAGKRAEDL